MRSLQENIFASIIRRYHCAFSLILDSELLPSCEWTWAIKGKPDRKIDIKPNIAKINPFVIFLVGERPDTDIFGIIKKPELYYKHFTGNAPLYQIEKSMGLAQGILSDGLYCGMSPNKKNIFGTFDGGCRVYGYNQYEFAYYTGRYLLNSYYGFDLPFPKTELLK